MSSSSLRVEAESARALRALLISSLTLVTLFAGLADAVFRGSLTHLDSRARVEVHQWSSPALTITMRYASALGSTLFLGEVLLVICAGLILEHRLRTAAWLTGSMAGAALIELTLKYSFHRPRPLSFFGASPPNYSFPSGHAVGSFCFYGLAAILASARVRSRGGRLLLAIGAIVLVLVIGYSRIYLGVHYLTDVLAGYLLGGTWLTAVGYGFCLHDGARGRLIKPDSEDPPDPTRTEV